MKQFSVTFHQEDRMNEMKVNKLSEQEFEKMTEGGVRQLFELDTNIGLFLFVDAEDHNGNELYLVLRYEEEDSPKDIYSFELREFYEFMALYLSEMYFDDDIEEEEEAYGPVHHLAHLLYHIYEDGLKAEPS